MSRLEPSPLLRLALRLDSVGSIGAGVLAVAFLQRLLPVLGAPQPWVLFVGLFMLAYGVAIGWLSARERLSAALVWCVVIGNGLWAAGSVALAFSGLIEPTSLGVALILGQALAVAVFAELQYFGLRRSATQARLSVA